ncbi:MAG TPA: chemotaxis protein CheA [Dissulfurispiraceae bacterium]|nr:chemotaxis protein CheA [Dissulfurispiraceae bacterium]
MPDEMDEIISEFVTEAEETLDRIDPLFVELESKGYDKEMLNEIFRGMHTLKGAAGFLGFQQIIDVAHRAESIMKRLRDNGIAPSRELMDVILTSVDMLRVLIGHVKVRDGAEEDISELLSRLDAAMDAPMDAGALPSAKQAMPAPAASVTVVTAAQAKRRESAETPEEAVVVEARKDVPSPPAPHPKPQTISDATEDQVQQTSRDREVVQTLRVDVTRIDKVMDLAGETVLARNRLLNLSMKIEQTYSGDPNIEGLLETTSFLDRVTSDLQLAVMKIRMQPISKVFSKFPRMVRDMSRQLNKDIDLEIFGEDTEVDKSVIENIGDPMVHIIRNSIDHGLETMDEREVKGKRRNGRIIISATQQGTQIVIEVTDDGRGIDVDAVRRKAIKNGIISEEEAEKMSDESAIDLIFLPGFSTKAVSTELSGRGVGMDVVKTNVAKLNGYVEVVTKKDIGSTFRISLPLTLAIIQAMMIRIGQEHYALPQSMIEETLRVKRSDIKDVAGQQVLTIRGKVLPLFVMSEVLGVRSRNAVAQDNSYVLVASVADRRFCIAVDELIGQEEVVIKMINGVESEECGILGATITGDGRVVLILDLAVIARRLFIACRK